MAAAKPLTSESIALTEKKMEMTLDDIIKMSKKNVGKGRRPARTSNKNRGVTNGGHSQSNSMKVQSFLESRSSIRQGVLARRRSNVPGSQFPLTTEVARRAAAAPIRNRGVNWNRPRVAPLQRNVVESQASGQDKAAPKQRQTLDARFARMKEQRMRVMSQQMTRGGVNLNASRRRGQQPRRQPPRQQPQQQQQRGRVEVAINGRRFGNSSKY